MEKDWAALTPEERREQRLGQWLNPEGVTFISPDAEESYRERVQRLIDAFSVEEPDRVPVIVAVGAIPAAAYGIDYHTAMYDHDKMAEAWTRFNDEYSGQLDSFAIPMGVTPARAYDLLDLRLYAYPGHGLPKNASGVQFVEGEYMMADEYDALIRDPSDFWLRVYMPRIFGALEPFRALFPLTDFVELPASKLLPFTRPDVQASLQALIDAGKELSQWFERVRTFTSLAVASGYPSATMGAFCKAPFDTLGDTLRGTKGIMMDMYRRPEKLLKAMDVMADLSIASTLSSINASKGFRALFPLHKGADGWMSDAQFDTFYWPPLRKVVNALIEEGISVLLFAEGSFDSRLDKVNEFPKGAVSWLFDRTDMARAKKMLGDRCCIMGNVPASLMVTGTPGDIRAYCRRLIEDCGGGGGYVLSPGILGIDEAKLANVKAMVDAAREFGTYRK
jgi:uroporphyrinogen-III decarboxylase